VNLCRVTNFVKGNKFVTLYKKAPILYKFVTLYRVTNFVEGEKFVTLYKEAPILLQGNKFVLYIYRVNILCFRYT
jgi:hypothetical protein